MSETALNTDETQRIEALVSFDAIEPAAPQSFREIVEQAALICEVPVAAINFISQDKQNFKAKVGLTESTAERQGSICELVLQKKIPIVVKNISQDPNVKSVSLPNFSEKIEFYAGQPLVSPQGFVLGTLFIMDVKVRELSKTQMDSLQFLALQVMHHLEANKKLRNLKLKVREAIHDVNNHSAIISGGAYFLKEATTKPQLDPKVVANNSERIHVAIQKVVQRIKDLRAFILS